MRIYCDSVEDMKTIDDMVHVGCFYRLFCALQYMLTLVISEGNTALHWAVWAVKDKGNLSAIEALVRMKADVNIRDGCACLACRFINEVDLKLFRRNGNSPLNLTRHTECIAAFDIVFIEALVNLKADVNAQDRLVPMFVML